MRAQMAGGSWRGIYSPSRNLAVFLPVRPELPELTVTRKVPVKVLVWPGHIQFQT